MDDALSLSAARPVRPRLLAESVFHQEPSATKLRRLSHDTRRATRPPFVVGAGDSARARFLKASAFGPRMENRGGGKSVFVQSSEFSDVTPRKASHTHASPRREDPPPRAEGGANGDVFAAAVDATRSLFDAVERRVRDAVAREIETCLLYTSPSPRDS